MGIESLLAAFYDMYARSEPTRWDPIDDLNSILLGYLLETPLVHQT